MPRPITTYQLDFIWITAKRFQQYVRKRSSFTAISWFKLRIYLQPKRNKKKTGAKKGKVNYKVFSGVQMPKLIMPYQLEILCLTAEVSGKRFMLHWEEMYQCSSSAFLDINVLVIKSWNVFFFQNLYAINIRYIRKKSWNFVSVS